MASLARTQVDIRILLSPSGCSISRIWLRKVARAGLRVAVMSCPGDGADGVKWVHGERPVQLGLVIADDDTVQQLNRDYRGSDEVTDVLSFSWSHQGHWQGDEGPRAGGEVVPFELATEGPVPLGEVIVSYPQAQRQAKAHGHSIENELAFLIVHGVLHVLGFDHEGPDEAAEMKAKEREALSSLVDGS